MTKFSIFLTNPPSVIIIQWKKEEDLYFEH